MGLLGATQVFKRQCFVDVLSHSDVVACLVSCTGEGGGEAAGGVCKGGHEDPKEGEV